jgi:hypothetical protein
MEGNDGRDDPFIKPYIDHLQELGVVDPNTGKMVTGPLEYIKAHLDENGNIIYEPLWTNLQKTCFGDKPLKNSIRQLADKTETKNSKPN